MEQDRYAITYRAAEARQVMQWIEAGQSGCLVGLRGAGKSNFLRFLLHEDVQRHYLGQNYANFAFVLINFLALTERTDWAVCELILDCLLSQLRLPDTEEAEEMESVHREVARSRDPLTARRAVERCIGTLCRRLAQRVILLFDEFDAVFQTLEPSLFRCLRAIRDAHKSQVLYVVVVTNDLPHLRDDLSEVEHFCRLVSRNVCYLGPYSEVDTRQMIRYLVSRRSVALEPGDTARLVELSGGHAGLLKATLSLLWDARFPGNLEELVPFLSDELMVQAECRKVWEGLSESEQAALCMLADDARADPHTLHRLQNKGLVRENRPEAPFFSSLFADFVRQQILPSLEDTIYKRSRSAFARSGTVVTRSPPLVQIDGQPVEDLTELEFELLCYLYEHRGQVCTKDDLIENVYRQQYARMRGGVTDGALQTLVSRLRAKIEPDRRPRYIVTIRGEGYKFVEPDAA